MNKIIEQLYIHSIDAIERDRYGLLQKNISLFKELYEIILSNESTDITKKISNLIDERITELFEKCFEKDKLDEAMELILNLYGTVFTQGHFVYLDDEIKAILKHLENSEFINENYLQSIYKLLQILRETADEGDSSQLNFVTQSHAAFYNIIYKNKLLPGYKKEDILKGYSKNISLLVLSRNKDTAKLVTQRVLKTMIDNRDIENFNNVTEDLFFLNGIKNESMEIIFNLAIYLYYLIYKEDLVDGNKFKAFLELDVFNRIGYDFSVTRNDLSLFASSAFKELTGWERMHGDTIIFKWMIMENVIKEFLVFIESSTNSGFFEQLDKEEISSYLMNFESDSVESLVERYKVFKSHFGFGINQEVAQELYDGLHKLKKLYVEHEINDCIGISKDLGLKEDLIKERLVDVRSKSLLINFKNDTTLTLDKELSYSISVPTIVFDHEQNIKSVVDSLKETMISEINKYIIKEFCLSKMRITNTHEDRINKLSIFIENMDCKNYNLIVTNIRSDSFFLYYENPEVKELYNERIKDYNLYLEETFFKPSFWFVTNSENIRYNASQINVNIKELNKVAINYLLSKYQSLEGKYEIPIINNIKVSLDIDLAIQYLQATRKSIELNLKLNFNAAKAEGSLVYFNKEKR
ncbi:hypothetical protein DV702_04835 [Sporosarcina sp. PTS2304]|uniref:hypothetical protein n=1 Tax=Sporosarcina sp. PTS2304 TaxID=2283194 RepID=UPI000E0D8041|nr:hypothetical protein [Sporosarcina sp. PTS2304]AXH99119.1 hypothetical protein DV702_04835 [Sporosarcina sp. PTS2304]